VRRFEWAQEHSHRSAAGGDLLSNPKGFPDQGEVDIGSRGYTLTHKMAPTRDERGRFELRSRGVRKELRIGNKRPLHGQNRPVDKGSLRIALGSIDMTG